MRLFLGSILGLLALLMPGYSEADEAGIRKGVLDYLAQQRFCMDSGLRRQDRRHWVDLEDADGGKKARALEAAKVIEIGRKEPPASLYKDWAWVRVPDEARQLFDEMDQLCFGRLELDKIEDFTIPAADAMGRIVSIVGYFYRVTNTPEWARTEGVRKAFPELEKAQSSVLKEEIKLVQTNRGWKYIPY